MKGVSLVSCEHLWSKCASCTGISVVRYLRALYIGTFHDVIQHSTSNNRSHGQDWIEENGGHELSFRYHFTQAFHSLEK